MAQPTLNELAQTAINAMAAINDIHKAWTDNLLAGGYAKHFNSCPQIDDDIRIALLSEIVRFDEDPQGSIDDYHIINDEPEIIGRVSMNDAEWDYSTSRGLGA